MYLEWYNLITPTSSPALSQGNVVKASVDSWQHISGGDIKIFVLLYFVDLPCV